MAKPKERKIERLSKRTASIQPLAKDAVPTTSPKKPLTKRDKKIAAIMAAQDDFEKY